MHIFLAPCRHFPQPAFFGIGAPIDALEKERFYGQIKIGKCQKSKVTVRFILKTELLVPHPLLSKVSSKMAGSCFWLPMPSAFKTPWIPLFFSIVAHLKILPSLSSKYV